MFREVFIDFNWLGSTFKNSAVFPSWQANGAFSSANHSVSPCLASSLLFLFHGKRYLVLTLRPQSFQYTRVGRKETPLQSFFILFSDTHESFANIVAG